MGTRGVQAYSWRGWLQVSLEVQVSGSRQGWIWAHMLLEGPGFQQGLTVVLT